MVKERMVHYNKTTKNLPKSICKQHQNGGIVKIWILLTIFITGCTPVSTHYQSTNTVNMSHPVDLCKLQKKVENSDAVTTKILHEISTTLNHLPNTSYTFNNTGDTSLSLPLDLQYNSEKNLTILTSVLSEIRTQLQKINDNQKGRADENQENKSNESG